MTFRLQSPKMTQVPPPNQHEQVLLGSSSASTSPDYSPAYRCYGTAAEEQGKDTAESGARRMEIKHDNVKYGVEEQRGLKRRKQAEIRGSKAAEAGDHGVDPKLGLDQTSEDSSTKSFAANENTSKAKSEEAALKGGNTYFIIDTRPTPVNIRSLSIQPAKRTASPSLETTEGKRRKKTKIRHDADLPNAEDKDKVQYEDINEEVDARLKEKEAKRKRKEEKKRKRESDGEPLVSFATAHTIGSTSAEVERPRRKKFKYTDQEVLADGTASKRGPEKNEGVSESREGMKKKRGKKHKGTVVEAQIPSI